MNRTNHQSDPMRGMIGPGFIPSRLEIKDQPEYARFPFNVLFANTKVVEGSTTLWSALYEPDLSTYQKSKDGNLAQMQYHNRYNRRWSLVIVWQKTAETEKYTGAKYSPEKDEPVLVADGTDWEGFFRQLTMVGPSTGETCEISPMMKQ